MIRHARMRGHRGAVPARPRPRLHRRPVRARRDPRQGRGEPRRRSGASATSSGCARSSTTTREVMLGQQRRVGGSADWGRLRYTMDEGSAKAVRVAFERLYRDGPRLPDRGARQLVPGLPDERQRPRGHRHARDRHAVVGPLPPHRRGDRPARPGRRRSRSPRPGPRRSSATPRSPSIPTTSATRASSAGACASRSSSATCRSSPTTSSTAPSGRARSRSRRPTITTTTRPACATACRRRRSWPTTRRSPDTGTRYDGLDRYEARAAIVADLEARGDLVGERRRTRWSSGAASAATTSSSRGSRRSGSSGPTPLAARALEATRVGPDADPARAIREDLGALADQHPRLERVAASCGGAIASRPGTARTAT